MFKFGTSGIRDLTENLLKDQIATKLAHELSNNGWQELSIGRDGRTGSEQLMAEFIANFPGKVNNLGTTTTPEITAQPGLAVMVTASHNPSAYCGFKIYLNHQEQNSAILKPTPIYQKWAQIPHDIVIDCANGGLGHKLKSLGFTNLINVEGEINYECGATHPENLANYCKNHKLEIGYAVDGDADRFLVYLGDHVLTSEETMLLIGKLLNLTNIVIDETVNSAISNHFQITRCKVGGQAVIAAMNEYNILFGAEKSGHYYFDMHIGGSDALDAIILITKGYRELGLNGLTKIINQYKPYHQFNKNVDIVDLPTDFESIITNFKLPNNVRKVIRKSGTEPLLRIMLEGKTEAAVNQAWQRLSKALSINL